MQPSRLLAVLDAFAAAQRPRMSDRGLSRLLGAGPTYVADLRTGRARAPRPCRLAQIADLLGVAPEELTEPPRAVPPFGPSPAARAVAERALLKRLRAELLRGLAALGGSEAWTIAA